MENCNRRHEPEMRNAETSDPGMVMTPLARAAGSAPVRVLHVIDNLNKGGAQVLLVDLCATRIQARQNCVHEVVTLHGEGPHAERLRSAGIVTRSLSSSKVFLHEIISRLASRLRCHNYDVLHLHLPAATLIGSFVARLITEVPVLVTVYAVKNQLRWPAYNLFRFVAPLVRCFVIIVPVSHAELKSIGVSDDKIRFLPMGLNFDGADPGRHDELRRALAVTYGFDAHRPLLLSVARLARDRHIHVLVDAMSVISQACPEALLLMIGDGDQRGELERTVRQRGLQRSVIFAEPRYDMWNVMPGCDVYLSAAVGDGTGVAAFQAMACARPVVAYDIIPMSEEQALRTKHGTFIAVRDAQALARVTCVLISDKDEARALGAKARRHIIEYASIDAMKAGYAELYDACARRSKGESSVNQSDFV